MSRGRVSNLPPNATWLQNYSLESSMAQACPGCDLCKSWSDPYHISCTCTVVQITPHTAFLHYGRGNPALDCPPPPIQSLFFMTTLEVGGCFKYCWLQQLPRVILADRDHQRSTSALYCRGVASPAVDHRGTGNSQQATYACIKQPLSHWSNGKQT